MLSFCSYAFLQICQYCLLINYLNKLADVEVQNTNPKGTSTKLYLDRLTKFNPQITQLINCINLYRFSADTQWQPEYYVILNICYFKTVRVAADSCPSVRCKEIAIYTYLYQTNYFQVRHITLHHTHTHTHTHTNIHTQQTHKLGQDFLGLLPIFFSVPFNHCSYPIRSSIRDTTWYTC